jgi:ribosome biogenesis GTPase A
MACALCLHPITITITTPCSTNALLQVVQSRFSFVVLLVDLLDASSTLLASLRTLVGANPVLLVATKADLLPGGTQPGRLVPWLRHLAAGKRLKLAGVHVVSSATGEGARLGLAPNSSARVW